MQEIVRRTFKICFDQIQKQNEHITKLVGSVASLKSQIAARPDYEEFEKLIDSKQHTKPAKGIGRDELERISHTIVNMKADLERKAGIGYVDDSLRRKVDKSDVLVHNLSKMTSSQYSGDISAIQHELEEIKLKFDHKSTVMTESAKELRSAHAGELSAVKSQLALLECSIAQTYSRGEVDRMVDQKVMI